ncbi:MAG: alpha/beta hydrolase [Chlamydiae bacterium]|nr:alpha/beta hydrolase [Chlamydiota bacterium]
MLRVTNEISHPYYFKESVGDCLNKAIWNVVSFIIFPIGMYRASFHLLNKYVISKFILPSTMSCYRKQKLIDEGDSTANYFNTDMRKITKLKIKTSEGIYLDGVSVVSPKQKDIPANNQKWLVYALPNMGVWQHYIKEFIHLSDKCGINVICVNYRGTGNSSPIQPLSFTDLFSDAEHSVLTLLKDGVRLQNIVIEGFSLGGASGLALGAKYQISAIAQNTFAKTSLVAKNILRRMPFKWMRSHFFYSIVKKILKRTGWEVDSRKPASILKNRLLIIQASHTDNVIPYRASLIKFFPVNPNGPHTSHLPTYLDPKIAHCVTAKPYRRELPSDRVFYLFLKQNGFLSFQ